MKKNSPIISAIDLFCGAGGLTHGLGKAKIRVEVGIDVDPACEYPYVKNNNAAFHLASVKDISPDQLISYWKPGSIRLLAGCAPCQTFSSYNQKATQEDERWWLLTEFARLLHATKPELVTMENVPGLQDQQVFNEFIEGLKSAGYHVKPCIVECWRYGLPQTRQRLVVVASKLGSIDVLSPEEFGAPLRTVRSAIESLPPIVAGEESIDPLHQSAALSPLNMRRIRASIPGGTWRDWPQSLRAECHRKSTGKSYPSVYGRMEWDKPSPTMTTQFYGYGNGRFGHPTQDRAISLREGAILQSFPIGYEFMKPGVRLNRSAIGRLIGNAVPVVLGELIGKTFLNHLQKTGKKCHE